MFVTTGTHGPYAAPGFLELDDTHMEAAAVAMNPRSAFGSSSGRSSTMPRAGVGRTTTARPVPEDGHLCVRKIGQPISVSHSPVSAVSVMPRR
jgi:hypothetical protein